MFGTGLAVVLDKRVPGTLAVIERIRQQFVIVAPPQGIAPIAASSIKLGARGIYEAAARLIRDPACLLLGAIFCVLYLPQAIIVVRDLGLITGFESDAGSHMAAIEAVLNTYNMHAGYHSKFYGWTYFAINFVLLTPLHLFLSAFDISDKTSIYLSIRLILFVIGLATVVTFYELLRRILFSRPFAFFGAFLYMTAPVCFTFFYVVHPETTGTLFLLLGCIALLNFAQNPNDDRFYVIALISVVLAALSKQIYFFMSLPVLAGFLIIGCRVRDTTPARFFLSLEFWSIFLFSAVVAFIILLFVHPFAVLDPRSFIAYQSVLGGFIDGANTLSIRQAMSAWLNVLKSIPLFIISAPLLIVSPLIFARRYRSTRQLMHVLGLLNCAAIVLGLGLVVLLNRLFVTGAYFQPVYPFVIILFTVALTTAWRLRHRALGAALLTAMLYAAFADAATSIEAVHTRLSERAAYRTSLAYQTYEYVLANVKGSDKIVYDQYVAIPQERSLNSCHYWNGCGTDQIEAFAPNIVMFNPSFEVNGPFAATERLKRYVKEHNLTLVANIQAVSVYKKLD